MTGRRAGQRLGELLVRRGLLTGAQLQEALDEQHKTREFLGGVLIRRGWLSPDRLAEVLSEQFDLPYERLPLEKVDWRVAAQFPASAMADGKCFPIRADERSVTVAVANPLDAWSLSAFQKAAAFRKVVPVLVSETDLRRVTEAHRQQSLRNIEQLLSQDDTQTQ